MFEKKIVNLGNGIWSCTCHEHSYEGEMQNGKYHGKGKMIDNFYDEESKKWYDEPVNDKG